MRVRAFFQSCSRKARLLLIATGCDNASEGILGNSNEPVLVWGSPRFVSVRGTEWLYLASRAVVSKRTYSRRHNLKYGNDIGSRVTTLQLDTEKACGVK